jgi:hypothetical protein
MVDNALTDGLPLRRPIEDKVNPVGKAGLMIKLVALFRHPLVAKV